MKIRNRLYLIFTLFLVIFILIGLTLFLANKQTNMAIEKADVANGIGKSLNELNMVTYEFLLYHEERMPQQWYLAYNSISKLLKKRNEKTDSPEEAAILQSMNRDIKSIHVLFLKLNEIHDKRQTLSRGNEQNEKNSSPSPLDAILASELLVKSHHATLGSLRLHAVAQKEMLETQRRSDFLIMIAMIIFMVVLLISGAFTIRSIATPISMLVERTNLIGKGDFDYKIKVKSGDEVGELAASFNKMAQNLLVREQALRESERFFSGTLNDMLTFVAILEQDGKVVFVNNTPLNVAGITLNDLKGKMFYDAFWWQYSEQARQQIKEDIEFCATGETLVHEIELQTRGGKLIWIEYSMHPVYNEDGEIKYLVPEGRDITERKLAEEKISKTNRLYATLSQVNQAIVRERDKQKLFQEICNIAIEYGKFRLAWIGFVDEEGKIVKPVAFSGEGSYYLQNIEISIDEGLSGKGPTGRAIREGKSVVFDDLENNSDFAPWREQAQEKGYRSSAAFPIRLNNIVIGALNVYAVEVHFFDEDEITLLEEAALDISFALEKFKEENKRKQAEKELHQYEHIVSSSLDMLALLDRNFVYLAANDSYLNAFGITRKELVNHSVSEILGKEFFKKVIKPNAEKCLSGEEVCYENWIDFPASGKKYMEINYYPYKNENDEIAGFVVNIRDITERKQAEAERQKTELRLGTILNIAADAIITVDKDQHINLFNQGAEKIFGYLAKEVLGRPIDILLPEQFVKLHRQHIRTFATGPESTRPMGSVAQGIFGKRKDGSEFPADASISRLTLNGETTFTVILRDITESKQAETLQLGRNMVLEKLATGAPLVDVLSILIEISEKHNPGMFCSVLLLDKERKHLLHGAAASLPDFYNKAINGIKVGPGIGSCGTAAYTGKRVIVEDIMTHTYWVAFKELAKKAGLRACWSEPIVSSSDQILGTFALYYREPRAPDSSDLEFITSMAHLGGIAIEKEQTEKALQKAHDGLEIEVAERTRELTQANIRLQEIDRLKSEFLATMSHELRTPLNSIIGFTGIIKKGIAGEINEEQKKQLSMVNGSAKHLLSLINDILDLSRIEAGKMELSVTKINLNAVISEVAQILSPLISQKGLKLLVETAEEIQEIYCDRKKFFQILLNLANNALKFTDQGEIKIKCEIDNDNLKVSISDTGIGIKKENINSLFEAFRQIDGTAQRRYEGTGLGLHLCRKLVTLLGGKIWAESEYGKGSKFIFTLPFRLGEGK
jgi:PAS domain S-box-containing protein